MKFLSTQLEGAVIVEPERHEDERGHFARLWCAEEFACHGLNSQLVQVNVSYNRSRGTLRGMHFQRSPHEEVKLVRCIRGKIYDVIVDLRVDSPTCRRWQGFELSAENGLALYVPEGFAHGFITLTDDSEVHYQMSERFHGDSAAGLRWNDPRLSIAWPECVNVISERDQNWALIA